MALDRVSELRHLTQRLFRRFGALSSDSTPCGKPLPLAHAHALMVMLARGELSQRELGRELCIDKSNVARLCAKMEGAGQLVQRPAEHDGRSRLVSLTRKGERLAGEVEAASRERFASLLRSLPRERHADVLSALSLMVEALEASAAAANPERKSA